MIYMKRRRNHSSRGKIYIFFIEIKNSLWKKCYNCLIFLGKTVQKWILTVSKLYPCSRMLRVQWNIALCFTVLRKFEWSPVANQCLPKRYTLAKSHFECIFSSICFTYVLILLKPEKIVKHSVESSLDSKSLSSKKKYLL